MENYDPKHIESKWQKIWEKNKSFAADDPSVPRKSAFSLRKSAIKPKFYGLIEFPYPSGNGLHVGHIRSNTAMDVISRKRRAEGYNVLYPIGWDAFGLPTENYAIKTGTAPKIVTKKNTDNFRRQLKALGFSFDWSREINTTDPPYFKWTQWIFLEMFKRGLAYKKKMAINWCPKDKIGLANEEVVDGKCERCGTPVEKREKEQWMLAITKYADRLDKDLDTVDFLPQIKSQQRNWIGRSVGAEIQFRLQYSSRTDADLTQTYAEKEKTEEIKVFTTRPDTLFGATYLVLAPEHPLVAVFLSSSRMRGSSLDSRLHGNDRGVQNPEEVEKYLAQTKNKTEIERTSEEKEKTGVELKGVRAINPANGEEIPVWIADYVLAGYGTGAIMAVPAHDERDFQFATRYNLSMKEVVTARTDADSTRTYAETEKQKAYTGDGRLINSGKFDGMESEEAKKKITEAVGGKIVTTYKLRDWIFSRQRYWGEPIPLIFCEHCKNVVQTESKHLNFYEQETWERLMSGEKTVETRALNPEEPDRYFGKIKKGEYLKCVNKVTGDIAYFKVVAATKLKNLEDLLAHPELLAKMKRNYTPTLDELKKGYSYTPDYLERIEKNGLVAFEVERTIPGWVQVPEKDLPVKLPEVKNYQPTDTGESPLAAISKWVNVKCPECGGKATRETDTMPNWAGSSWYYLRYIDPKNKKEFVGKNKLAYWSASSPKLLTTNYSLLTAPVDWYNGGMEHTTLHLLYSRFWHKFLYDCGYVPTPEPYAKRTSHGLILAANNEKMSKSRGNVINPDEIIEQFGADALRVYEMFMGPFDQAIAWNTDGIVGTRRFLEKVWRISQSVTLADAGVQEKKTLDSRLRGNDREAVKILRSRLENLLHQTIKKVSEDIEGMRFNTAISSLMILTNEMEKAETVSVADFKILLQLLAPFAPHIAEELWEKTRGLTQIPTQINADGRKIRVNRRSHPRLSALASEPWPKYDASKLVSESVKITVQINGKFRAVLDAPRDSIQTTIETLAKSDPSVSKWLGSSSPIKKVIFVSNRLINFVV